MSTPLIPQEVYLLERYTSVEYFKQMRDAWANMLEAAEQAVQEYQANLPLDTRSKPLYDQIDVVWNERVLPNFRGTMEALNEGLRAMEDGDLSALGYAGNVNSDARGQRTEYWDTSWMGEKLEQEFNHWQGKASDWASNIGFTQRGEWAKTDLSTDYDPEYRGPLDAPASWPVGQLASWPVYQLNPEVRVKTGDKAPITGIYLPDCDDSCAMFRRVGSNIQNANVGYDPETHQNITTAPTKWTLVRRIADSGGDNKVINTNDRLRCEAGQPCPKTGFYFAKASSCARKAIFNRLFSSLRWSPANNMQSRHFKQGETMPEINSDWGKTVWYYTINNARTDSNN